METIVKVALKIAHNDGIFSYSINEKLCESEIFGRRVKVELKNRLMTGAVIGIDDSCKNKFKIKEIIEIIDDEPIITKEQFELMKFTSRYYFNDLGTCVHLAVPKNEKAHRIKKVFPKTHKNLSQLSVEQNSLSQRIKSNLSGAYLLEGITGSGKTHIYIDIANTVLEQKKSVLFIVPEISLTPQLVERVEKALGQKAVVMHSNVSPAQKRDGIFHLLSNDSQILIGARSAIFAPLKNLGLIVVDEEHDSSLKQEDSPQYNARDLALWRAKNERACIILGSATPSLESIYNVQNKKLTHLKLEHRFHQDSKLADIEVIDLKERFDDVDFRTQDLSKSSGSKMCILSRPLVNAIKESIEQDLQVLLFLNQRGYARFGVCYQCGTMVECPHCSVGLTYYQKRQSLVCHQCQHVEYAQSTCKNCLNDSIRFVGLGTERLHEEVKLLFPDLVIERLDRDVIQSQIRLEKVLKSMHDRTAHILIGTQMIAKGHDFLHVGLVGVVCADVGLSMPDFRAAEKTFQLLTQVAGRAGRGQKRGKAIIQTFNPSHPSIYFCKNYDSKGFIQQELALRKRFNQPPFSRAVLLRAEHKNADIAQSAVTKAHHFLKAHHHLQLLGPTPSSIERINNRYRFQLLALSPSTKMLHQSIAQLKNNSTMVEFINKNKVRFTIDVDPQTTG